MYLVIRMHGMFNGEKSSEDDWDMEVWRWPDANAIETYMHEHLLVFPDPGLCFHASMDVCACYV